MQGIIDHAMSLSVGDALEKLVQVYGRDSRVYSLTFVDGKWVIAVMTTYNNKVIARFTHD